jgi:hypothetical protein
MPLKPYPYLTNSQGKVNEINNGSPKVSTTANACGVAFRFARDALDRSLLSRPPVVELTGFLAECSSKRPLIQCELVK